MGELLKRLEAKIADLNRQIEAQNAQVKTLADKRRDALLNGDLNAASFYSEQIEKAQRRLALLKEGVEALRDEIQAAKTAESEVQQILNVWNQKAREAEEIWREIDGCREKVKGLIERLRGVDEWQRQASARLQQLKWPEIPAWPATQIDRVAEAFATKGDVRRRLRPIIL